MKYKAFISYKHEQTTEFAQRLELSLKTYAKKIFKPPLKIFRDENHLMPGIDLPAMILNALEESEFLILLASPGAAESKWVHDELINWCDTLNRRDRLIIVLTEGSISTDPETKRIDWDQTTSLPVILKKHIDRVPLYIDMRWAKGAASLDLINPEFKHAVNLISARLRGLDPNEMSGIEVREHRKSMRWWKSIAVILFALTVVSIGAALIARQQTRLAEHRLVEAVRTADHLNVVIHRELESIAGADQIRRELFNKTGQLLKDLKADTHPEVRYSTTVRHLESGNLALTHDNTQKARQEFESARKLLSELRQVDPTNGWLIEDFSIVLLALGDVARKDGLIAVARKFYGEALDLRKELKESPTFIPRWNLRFATALERLGELDDAEGLSSEALNRFKGALKLRKKSLDEGNAGTGAIRNYAISLLRIADIEAKTGATAEAGKKYQHGLKTLEDLIAKNPNEAQVQNDLTVFLERLGGKQNLERVLAIRLELARAEPDNGVWQMHLAIAYAKLGEFFEGRGKRITALQYLQNGLEVLERLDVDQRGVLDWQRQLAELYDRFGDLGVIGGSVDPEILLERALAIKQKLAEFDSARVAMRHSVAATHIKLGDLALRRGDRQRAETNLNAAYGHLKALTTIDGSRVDWMCDLASTHDRLAKITDSRYHLEHSLALRQAVLYREPDIAEYKYAFAKSLQEFAAVIETEDPVRAFDLYERTITITDPLTEAEPERLIWWDVIAVANSRLGDINLKNGTPSAAINNYQKALYIVDQLSKKDRSNLDWTYKSSVLSERLGDVFFKSSPQKARHNYKTSLSQRHRLVKQEPLNVGFQRNLAVAFYKLGRLEKAEKKAEEARHHLRNALKIMDRLCTDHSVPQKYLIDRIEYLSVLANLDVQDHDLKRAAAKLRRIIEIRRKILEAGIDKSTKSSTKKLAEQAAKLYRAYRTLGDVETHANNLDGARKAFEQSLAFSRQWSQNCPIELNWLKYELEALAKLNNTAQAMGDTGLTGKVQQEIADFLRRIDQMGALREDHLVKEVRRYLARGSGGHHLVD